jgi:membrane-associated PAP2 superfamily phosphatase
MNSRKRWLAQQIVYLLVSAAGLLSLFENTHLDIELERWFFDSQLHNFPLRHHWLLSAVMHHGLKSLSYALGLLSIVYCLHAWRGRVSWLPPRHAALAGLGMLLIPLSISLLKHLTNRHCPWDTLEFGGYAPYLWLFATPPSGMTQGQCFPAGHASAGLSWLAWGFALLGLQQRWARYVLLTSLSLGGLLGLGRMLQGAHFLSHTLWSIWFAWGICVMLTGLTGVQVVPPPQSEPLPSMPTNDSTPTQTAHATR